MAVKLLEHTTQSQAFRQYAIKNGDLLDETTLNSFCKLLKKELDDLYNIISLMLGRALKEFDPSVEYKVGEMVLYQDKNYIAIETSQGILPTDTKYWSTSTKFNDLVGVGGDYLSLRNQNSYDSGALQTGEGGVVDYHPATVKFVLDSIKLTLNKEYNDLLKRVQALEAKG